MALTDPELNLVQMKQAVMQMIPILPEYAKMQRAYFLALKKEGFNSYQALVLCAEYMKIMLNLK